MYVDERRGMEGSGGFICVWGSEKWEIAELTSLSLQGKTR
jgi:hypothetical protein